VRRFWRLHSGLPREGPGSRWIHAPSPGRVVGALLRASRAAHRCAESRIPGRSGGDRVPGWPVARTAG